MLPPGPQHRSGAPLSGRRCPVVIIVLEERHADDTQLAGRRRVAVSEVGWAGVCMEVVLREELVAIPGVQQCPLSPR
jgi:hypothetical protein